MEKWAFSFHEDGHWDGTAGSLEGCRKEALSMLDDNSTWNGDEVSEIYCGEIYIPDFRMTGNDLILELFEAHDIDTDYMDRFHRNDLWELEKKVKEVVNGFIEEQDFRYTIYSHKVNLAEVIE